MNPRTQFVIVVTVLVVVMGLLTFSKLPMSGMRASAASSPPQPGVPFSAPAETGAISGHVFKADGVTVITDVLISVHAHGISMGTSSFGTYASQADGSYTISGLAPGTYKVQGNNNHVGYYISEYYNNKLSWDQADIITVVAGQTNTGIDFALGPGGAISGHVYEQDGITPVANACVNVSSTAPKWTQVAGFCCTASDGGFTITGIPVGRVYVQTSAGCQGQHGSLIDEWYATTGSTPNGTLASPVDVVAGQTVSNINFALDVGGSISGHVFKADGVSVITDAIISVGAESVSSGSSNRDAVVSQADGSYTISGLAPGTYKMQGNTKRVGGYVDKWYNNKYVWSQADTIVVAAGQAVTGIDFNLEAGGAISGHVFMADGVSVITDVPIMVQAMRVTPAPGGLGVRISQTDGSYTIAGLAPGTYKVQANNQRAPGYVSEYYDNKLSWEQADIVTVVAGQTTTDIDFVPRTGRQHNRPRLRAGWGYPGGECLRHRLRRTAPVIEPDRRLLLHGQRWQLSLSPESL